MWKVNTGEILESPKAAQEIWHDPSKIVNHHNIMSLLIRRKYLWLSDMALYLNTIHQAAKTVM